MPLTVVVAVGGATGGVGAPVICAAGVAIDAVASVSPVAACLMSKDRTASG